MNKIAIPFVAAIVPLIAGIGIATASNAQSKMSDEAYCKSLSHLFRMGHAERGFAPLSNDTAVAIAQCQEGQPESAIPVLEQRLRDMGYTVPSRS
jgi:hypothetical protein